MSSYVLREALMTVFDAFINEREVARQPINLIKEAFPVGHIDLTYETLSGMVYFSTDTIPVL